MQWIKIRHSESDHWNNYQDFKDLKKMKGMLTNKCKKEKYIFLC